MHVIYLDLYLIEFQTFLINSCFEYVGVDTGSHHGHVCTCVNDTSLFPPCMPLSCQRSMFKFEDKILQISGHCQSKSV